MIFRYVDYKCTQDFPLRLGDRITVKHAAITIQLKHTNCTTHLYNSPDGIVKMGAYIQFNTKEMAN